LWRIQHGEIPPEFNPKVFWILAGTNDLSSDLCSEEIVTLGLMRLAEEIHHHYPKAVVVLQGILPRSNHKDGTLQGDKERYRRPPQPTRSVTKDGLSSSSGYDGRTKATLTTRPMMHPGLGFGGDAMNPYGVPSLEGGGRRHLQMKGTSSARLNDPSSSKSIISWEDATKMISKDRAPYPRADFYLWPSIKTINKALEAFCTKHEHLVYFDADNLVLGSIGNNHYRAPHQTIIADLMPNFVHLSATGHRVVLQAIWDEVQRIILDDDEGNDIETRHNTLSSTNNDGNEGRRR